jgi:plasmid maintenance system antidote protein VapI
MMITRGERVQEALRVRGVRKQQALAAELEVHESAITRWKENKSMSLENAVALGVALDVSLDWLLLGRGTIDSHRSLSQAHAENKELGRIVALLGPRSRVHLVALLEAIGAESAKRTP